MSTSQWILCLALAAGAALIFWPKIKAAMPKWAKAPAMDSASLKTRQALVATGLKAAEAWFGEIGDAESASQAKALEAKASAYKAAEPTAEKSPSHIVALEAILADLRAAEANRGAKK